MRTLVLSLLATTTLAACGAGSAAACRDYVRAANACSTELGSGSSIPSLSADAYCLAYTLPGVPKDPDVAKAFSCLADAYDAADCSSSEAFSDTFEDTCDDVPDEGDTD